MKFVCRNDYDSTYLSDRGERVSVPHGWTTRYEFTEEVIRELWDRYPRPAGRKCWCGCGMTIPGGQGRPDLEEFREYLRARLTDPDRADDLVICYRCDDPGDDDWFYVLGTGDSVCEYCRDNHYSACDDCDELWEYTTSTSNGREVCEDCRSNRYSWCEDCEVYYPDDYGCGETHAQDCECESPALAFAVRNDGEPSLENDVRVTVTLPAGTISAEGISEIGRYLRDVSCTFGYDDPARDNMWRLSYDLEPLGDQWQAKQGNYPKRLSRLAYTKYQLKLTPEVMSKVGTIARDHSTAVDFEVEVTRELNRSPEEFAHADSCWWQSYAGSRCALKSNGGFGLRTFEGRYVTGRAWVMPLRQTEDECLVPTFETLQPDAFVVFNGYGVLNGYTPARIVSHMAGMTYRKITFTCSPMYVNNSAGYLVAPEEIATRYTDGSLYLSTTEHSDLYFTERTLTNA